MTDRSPSPAQNHLQLTQGDALLVVDVQNDFLPRGSLAVAHGDDVVPVLDSYIALFVQNGAPVFATRDWHPAAHCSFNARGGPWPAHCVADTVGAQFAPALHLPPTATIISKATRVDQDAYSGFEGTDMDRKLRSAGVTRLFIGGLATDYCVLNTVRDAVQLGYSVLLLVDAIRAVNVHPDDGARAELEMRELGARPICFDDLRT